MNITNAFLDFALLGAEWVMWLLVALSFFSIAVMIERGLFLMDRRIDVDALQRDLRAALRDGDKDAVRSRWASSRAMAAQVAIAALDSSEHGPDAVAEAMSSAKTQARTEHEKNLVVLGTLGNNAPFIGLFGTVLGIIQAFHELGKQASSDDISSVMSGISEALVATAVGLLVAIPAVVMFNFYNRRIRAIASATDGVAHMVLSELHADEDT